MDEEWERVLTETGLPYYVNHQTEKTYWNHPLIMELERKIFSFSKIKYAAYRMAVKLRAIQKAVYGCNLKLSTLKEFFELNDMEQSLNAKESIATSDLMKILKELFLFEIKSGGNLPVSPILASDLMLNWLANVHDGSRKGWMRLLSVKISLILICAGSPRQKYHYLFSQLKSQQGSIDEERIGFFIQACLKIPKYLKEHASFGLASIQPAVKSFLKQTTDRTEGLSEDFVQWMLAEPQPLVWIPTLYRLAASETVKHECKCSNCKQFPMVGFRYKCLQCFNFDICQECFWTGRTSKNHKLDHPTQEYCLPSSQASDLKDVKKMFKNKLFKGKKNKKNQSSKKRYTEIPPDQQSVASGGKDYEGIDENENGNGSQASVYQTSTDYSGDASSVAQNNKSIEEINEVNTWEPETQPLPRRGSMDSLPMESVNDDASELNYTGVSHAQPDLFMPRFSPDQKAEIDRAIANIEEDNRELQNQMERMRDGQQEEDRRKSMLTSENARLKLEKRRADDRQQILEEHNRRLEMEMQKMRLLLQQRQDASPLAEGKEIRQVEDRKQNSRQLLRNTNVEPIFNKKPLQHHLNMALSPSTNSKTNASSILRIPTSISIKNSKVAPVYEEIPDEVTTRLSQPVQSPHERRTAWGGIRPSFNEIPTLQHPKEEQRLNHAPIYEEIPDRWSGRVRAPTKREDRQFNMPNFFSQEEQELDRTVMWAMDNFVFSETDSSC